jgi:hypothetical protein
VNAVWSASGGATRHRPGRAGDRGPMRNHGARRRPIPRSCALSSDGRGEAATGAGAARGRRSYRVSARPAARWWSRSGSVAGEDAVADHVNRRCACPTSSDAKRQSPRCRRRARGPARAAARSPRRPGHDVGGAAPRRTRAVTPRARRAILDRLGHSPKQRESRGRGTAAVGDARLALVAGRRRPRWRRRTLRDRRAVARRRSDATKSTRVTTTGRQATRPHPVLACRDREPAGSPSAVMNAPLPWAVLRWWRPPARGRTPPGDAVRSAGRSRSRRPRRRPRQRPSPCATRTAWSPGRSVTVHAAVDQTSRSGRHRCVGDGVVIDGDKRPSAW